MHFLIIFSLILDSISSLHKHVIIINILITMQFFKAIFVSSNQLFKKTVGAQHFLTKTYQSSSLFIFLFFKALHKILKNLIKIFHISFNTNNQKNQTFSFEIFLYNK